MNVNRNAHVLCCGQAADARDSDVCLPLSPFIGAFEVKATCCFGLDLLGGLRWCSFTSDEVRW